MLLKISGEAIKLWKLTDTERNSGFWLAHDTKYLENWCTRTWFNLLGGSAPLKVISITRILSFLNITYRFCFTSQQMQKKRTQQQIWSFIILLSFQTDRDIHVRTRVQTLREVWLSVTFSIWFIAIDIYAFILQILYIHTADTHSLSVSLSLSLSNPHARPNARI